MNKMSNTSKPLPRRRGFWLLELMTVLVLLAAFALIATRLFAATLKMTHAAGEAKDATASIDAGIAALRADVWAAATISTTNPQMVALTLPGGRAVVWSIKDDHLTRLEANKEVHWQAPRGASLASDGATLSVKTPQTMENAGVNEMRMSSQALLLSKLRP